MMNANEHFGVNKMASYFDFHFLDETLRFQVLSWEAIFLLC